MAAPATATLHTPLYFQNRANSYVPAGTTVREKVSNGFKAVSLSSGNVSAAVESGIKVINDLAFLVFRALLLVPAYFSGSSDTAKANLSAAFAQLKIDASLFAQSLLGVFKPFASEEEAKAAAALIKEGHARALAADVVTKLVAAAHAKHLSRKAEKAAQDAEAGFADLAARNAEREAANAETTAASAEATARGLREGAQTKQAAADAITDPDQADAKTTAVAQAAQAESEATAAEQFAATAREAATAAKVFADKATAAATTANSNANATKIKAADLKAKAEAANDAVIEATRISDEATGIAKAAV